MFFLLTSQIPSKQCLLLWSIKKKKKRNAKWEKNKANLVLDHVRSQECHERSEGKKWSVVHLIAYSKFGLIPFFGSILRRIAHEVTKEHEAYLHPSHSSWKKRTCFLLVSSKVPNAVRNKNKAYSVSSL